MDWGLEQRHLSHCLLFGLATIFGIIANALHLSPHSIVVAKEGAVDFVSPMSIIALETQFYDRHVSRHHHANSFLCWPPKKDITHLALMGEPELLDGRRAILGNAVGQLSNRA